MIWSTARSGFFAATKSKLVNRRQACRGLQLEWRKNAQRKSAGAHKTGIGWKTLNGKFRLQNRKHSGARPRKHSCDSLKQRKITERKGKDNAARRYYRPVDRWSAEGSWLEKKLKAPVTAAQKTASAARRNQKDNILACIVSGAIGRPCKREHVLARTSRSFNLHNPIVRDR